ncbi:MAG: alpha/beta fold hydrolase [Solirubrobacteraceae bacterium]
MIVGGLGDRLAPPEQSRLPCEHWERCRLHWFPGSHVLHVERGNYFKEMLEFMRAAGFQPRVEGTPSG